MVVSGKVLLVTRLLAPFTKHSTFSFIPSSDGNLLYIISSILWLKKKFYDPSPPEKAPEMWRGELEQTGFEEINKTKQKALPLCSSWRKGWKLVVFLNKNNDKKHTAILYKFYKSKLKII